MSSGRVGEEETVLPLWPQREGPVGSELSRRDDNDADGRDCFLSHTLSCERLKSLTSKL